MTRKDFEAIAALLRNCSTESVQEPTDHELGRIFQSELIAWAFCSYFASENERFDSDRFLAACKP